MITAMQSAHLEQVMAIWLDSNIQTHFYVPEQYWLDHYEMVKEVLPRAEVWLDVEDEQVRGFIGLGDYHHIAGLFVAAPHRRQGVGSALLNKCQQLHPFLTLDVYTQNVRATAFYLQNGFIVRQETENPDTGEMQYSMAWPA